MRDISLHVLDIVQNSVRAGASEIKLYINEDEAGFFVFRVEDNGCGMSAAMLSHIRDPFTTTRSTRKVGLGIPLLDMTTAQTGGRLEIESREGVGTTLSAYFAAESIDMPAWGDLAGTIVTLVCGTAARLSVRYVAQGGEFTLDSEELRAALGEDVDFMVPEVYGWLDGYVRQEIARVREE